MTSKQLVAKAFYVLEDMWLEAKENGHEGDLEFLDGYRLGLEEALRILRNGSDEYPDYKFKHISWDVESYVSTL